MTNVKALAIIVSLLVFTIAVAPNITGFVTAVDSGGCRGVPTLTLDPNPVQAGKIATARVSGLMDCNGKTVDLKLDSCFGAKLGSFRCVDKFCTSTFPVKLSAPKDYLIAACIDKNGNGYLYDAGERAASLFKVRSMPDVYVNKISFLPADPRRGQQVIPVISVGNRGSASAYFFNLRVTLSQKDSNNRDATITSWENNVQVDANSVKDFRAPGYSLSPGDYKVTVELDRLDYIVELNERDNNANAKLKVYP
ncbi:MAG: hypothetical protein HYT16_02550 [DPANN group archaeon]|nr:hypothetical protein [DPANN group archaeon]